jgi:hypothetical protein
MVLRNLTGQADSHRRAQTFIRQASPDKKSHRFGKRQKSEVRGQMSEGQEQGTKVGERQRSEVGGRKSEVRRARELVKVICEAGMDRYDRTS